MTVKRSAADWKAFYAAERGAMGERGLFGLFDRAPDLQAAIHRALVFPHTMLGASGHLVAAVARAAVRSGADSILAIGVLHGARKRDAKLVNEARAGAADAIRALRGIHAAGETTYAAEEFSLDNFEVLVELAARLEGRAAPRIVARFPFLVGDDPATLPGIDEVSRMAAEMPIVATADPMHYGVGYSTDSPDKRSDDGETRSFARRAIEEQLHHLAGGAWSEFRSCAQSVRSDFVDGGPVLTHCLRRGRRVDARVVDLELVDYAAALEAASPTWVAAPLLEFTAEFNPRSDTNLRA